MSQVIKLGGGGGAGGVTSVPTDSGTATPAGGILNIITGVSTLNSGSSIEFTGSTNIVELNVTDPEGNTIIGQSAGNSTISGGRSTGFGVQALSSLSIGASNTAIGFSSLSSLTSGGSNVGLGFESGFQLVSGSFNTIIGGASGFFYTGAESYNICINNPGIAGESNVIKIGSSAHQSTCYIAGIDGVNVGSVATVVTEASNQLGTAVLTGGTGITITPTANTITVALSSNVSTIFSGDSGTASPSTGNINIIAGVSTLTSGSTVKFTGTGSTIELFVTDSGTENTIIGNAAGKSGITGLFNTCLGKSAASSLTSGGNNVGIGYQSLKALTSGADNTCVGYQSGAALTTGGPNVLIGAAAGSGYTTSESNNIAIGNGGTTGESNVIRIGVAVTQTKCFIAGIRGITTVNANAVAVLIDSTGQLGTVSSSARYKDNIEDMGDESDVLHKLRPVTFEYKTQNARYKSVGLIAEEVHDVAPRFVVYDEDGRPETVKYHDLVPMLLNELIKLKKEVDILKGKL